MSMFMHRNMISMISEPLDDPFDPDDMENMARRFTEIVAGEDDGYEMIFYISENDAEDLLENFRKAQNKDRVAIQKCWIEYSKIMYSLEEAKFNPDEDDLFGYYDNSD